MLFGPPSVGPTKLCVSDGGLGETETGLIFTILRK